MSNSLTQEDIRGLSSYHNDPLFVEKTDSLYLAAGGIRETLFIKRRENSSKADYNGWLSSGIGFKESSAKQTVLSDEDWNSLLSESNPDLDSLNGHFICARWREKYIEFYTDQLGIRTLFLAQLPGKVVFSTRLEWIARYTGYNEIDFTAFGSHWLLFNQLSHRCVIKNIIKLGQRGKAVCIPDSIRTEHTLWKPESSRSKNFEVSAILSGFLNPSVFKPFSLSLSLSGGLDSRVLLSLLTSGSDNSFSVLSLGSEENPDVIIAKKITQKENLDLIHRFDPINNTHDCLKRLFEYCSSVPVLAPASSILFHQYYPQLYDQKLCIIDGAFGEIGRRRFLNKILYKGRKSLVTKDISEVFTNFCYSRAAIFTPETEDMMKKGAFEDIDVLLNTEPGIDEVGIENFLELIAIRTRLPNAYSYEQSRLDGIIPYYMPYVQPLFLNKIFELPVRERKSGRLYKRIIRKSSTSLTRFPLVKKNTTYPFRCSYLQSILYTKLKSKWGLTYNDRSQIEFLKLMSDYVQDTLRSQEVKNCDYYDYEKVNSMIGDFYKGDETRALEVDWWLSFHCWYKSLRDRVL
ncbi:hypothetical protein ACFL6L_00805 [candidate division KSB1 bacterium]